VRFSFVCILTYRCPSIKNGSLPHNQQQKHITKYEAIMIIYIFLPPGIILRLNSTSYCISTTYIIGTNNAVSCTVILFILFWQPLKKARKMIESPVGQVANFTHYAPALNDKALAPFLALLSCMLVDSSKPCVWCQIDNAILHWCIFPASSVIWLSFC